MSGNSRVAYAPLGVFGGNALTDLVKPHLVKMQEFYGKSAEVLAKGTRADVEQMERILCPPLIQSSFTSSEPKLGLKATVLDRWTNNARCLGILQVGHGVTQVCSKDFKPDSWEAFV